MAQLASETLRLLGCYRTIMISRTRSAENALATIGAAREGGLRAVEVTFTVPGATGVLARLAGESDSGLLVGAGTVLTLDQARAAVDAGASFLASPGLDQSILEFAVDRDVLMLPGILTPTEALRAQALGAIALKLFPASSSGPGFLRALLGPLPELRVIPTGGISSTNAAAWIESGALAVGVGGPLSPDPPLDAGDLRRVRDESQAICAAVNSFEEQDVGSRKVQ